MASILAGTTLLAAAAGGQQDSLRNLPDGNSAGPACSGPENYQVVQLDSRRGPYAYQKTDEPRKGQIITAPALIDLAGYYVAKYDADHDPAMIVRAFRATGDYDNLQMSSRFDKNKPPLVNVQPNDLSFYVVPKVSDSDLDPDTAKSIGVFEGQIQKDRHHSQSAWLLLQRLFGRPAKAPAEKGCSGHVVFPDTPSRYDQGFLGVHPLP